MTDRTNSPFSVAPQTPTLARTLGSSGIVRRLIGAVVVFAVVSVGGIAWAYLSDAPETAEIGDCLTGRTADSLRTVDCADPAAAYRVVGKVEDRTEAEFVASDVARLCAAQPTARNAYWEGKKGGKGYVLCLEPVG